MATLFMANVPHNCNESDLCDWVEANGQHVRSVRLIRDIVSGASPSFAYVNVDEEDLSGAVERLNGQSIRGRTIIVREARHARSAA